MRLEFVRPNRSISGPVTDEEIADFVVLTGPNGSGKSNLLAAINERAMLISGVTSADARPGHVVRLLQLGQLKVADSADHALGSHRGAWRAVAEDVRRLVQELTGPKNALQAASDELEAEVRNQLQAEDRLSGEACRVMTEAAGKRIIDFDEDDYRRYAPVMAGIRDPFALTVSELFLSYHGRLEENEYAQWRHDTGKASRRVPLSDAEFSARYGPPPWDLLNEILGAVGLEYRISPPVSDDDTGQYKLRLTHLGTGVDVVIGQLSSGETTLLGLGMSLYSGLHLGEATWLPRVLLLDEPDASLHPSMIRSLLRVIDDVFVQRHGMKVMVATHSPTTVALAPEPSLYTISRTGSPRLKRASRDEALASLMVGLPTLSIREENRIPVFVESEDDESCYQEFFRLLKDRLNTPYTLEFIASGRKGNGNDDAVIRLVRKLRDAESPVRGIVDRDDRQGASEGIVYLPNRRTLENLVLDPLPLGLLLLREGFIKSDEMIGEDMVNSQLRAEHAQLICDYLTSKMLLDGDSRERATIRYAGDFEVSAPAILLEMRKDDLTERMLQAFPMLKKFTRSELMRRVIELAIRDRPDFAPQDVLALFSKLITA